METAQNHLQKLDIWYCCSMRRCNFSCAYCVASQRRSKQITWKEGQKERFLQIVKQISAIPYSIGIRLQTIGEPFLSATFLESACSLTLKSNIRFVELVTNGSLLKSKLDQMKDKADFSKLSLWVTYHHGQISLSKFFEQIQYAKSLGLSMTVNQLLFPNTFKVTERLNDFCRDHNVKFNIDIGQNYHNSKEVPLQVLKSDVAKVLDFYNNNFALLVTVLAYINPYMQKCSAGHDYICIDTRGHVFPCSKYSRNHSHCIGSLLEGDFKLTLRKEVYHSCLHTGSCACKEDYSHLKVLAPFLDENRTSLGFNFSKLQDICKNIVNDEISDELNIWTIQSLLFLKEMLKNKSTDGIGLAWKKKIYRKCKSIKKKLTNIGNGLRGSANK